MTYNGPTSRAAASAVNTRLTTQLYEMDIIGGRLPRLTVRGIIGWFCHEGYTPAEARRFADKIRVNESGCWVWVGALNSKGYGCLGLRKVAWLAHRLAHVVFIGPIPDGFEVDHVRAKGCTSLACVNPEHLEAVTPMENCERANMWRPSRTVLIDMTAVTGEVAA
jgi:hypothetical protein